MLIKVYPRSKYIFEASDILDEIRAELLTLETAKGIAEIIGRIEHICLILIPKLQLLNQQYFQNSSVIAQTLALLSNETGSLRLQTAWEHLIELEGNAERDNFGAWRI